MTLLDVLIGLVAIAISFAVMASICFLGGTVFYYFYNKKKAEPMRETVLKKTKKRNKR
jgi:hypothetical protein